MWLEQHNRGVGSGHETTNRSVGQAHGCMTWRYFIGLFSIKTAELEQPRNCSIVIRSLSSSEGGDYLGTRPLRDHARDKHVLISVSICLIGLALLPGFYHRQYIPLERDWKHWDCDAHPCFVWNVTVIYFSCDQHWMVTCSIKKWNIFGINPSIQLLPVP